MGGKQLAKHFPIPVMKCPFYTHVHLTYKIENVTFYIQKLLQYFLEPGRTLKTVHMDKTCYWYKKKKHVRK